VAGCQNPTNKGALQRQPALFLCPKSAYQWWLGGASLGLAGPFVPVSDPRSSRHPLPSEAVVTALLPNKGAKP